MSKKIGLALGSGGARGIAHIGVLKELEKNNIKIDYLAGCSMGALIGGSYALSKNIKELEEIALSFNKRWSLNKIADLNLPHKSLIKGFKVSKFIESLVYDKKFNETKIPLKIIATELASGDEVVLDKGKISDAIRASISLPGIFPLIKINNKYLLDGGLVNPTPADIVQKMGADITIAVDFIINSKQEFKNPGIFTVLMQSYEIMREQAVKYRIKEKKNLIIIKPDIRSAIDSFKFRDIEKIIEFGAKATRKAMPGIKKLIAQ